MPQAGYLGSNIARNVQIAHGVRTMFKRSGESTWVDLGDLADVSIATLAEFLEHFSNHDGRNALQKKILQNRGLSLNITLREINLENLRFALYGGAVASGSINIIATATPQRVGLTFTLPETPITGGVISVKSEDGSKTYTVTTEYTVSGAVITIVPSGSIDEDVAVGGKVHVTYQVAFGGTAARKFTLMSNTNVVGAVQFHVRNQDGGLAQIYELDECTIGPAGDTPFAVDAVQSLPMIVTAQLVNGEFGRAYFKNV